MDKMHEGNAHRCALVSLSVNAGKPSTCQSVLVECWKEHAQRCSLEGSYSSGSVKQDGGVNPPTHDYDSRRTTSGADIKPVQSTSEPKEENSLAIEHVLQTARAIDIMGRGRCLTFVVGALVTLSTWSLAEVRPAAKEAS